LESIQECGEDLIDWNNVKAQFLKTYEPKYSAHTTCTNFANLVQRPSKSVDNYLPNQGTAIRATIDATTKDVKREDRDDMSKFFKHQHFLIGLCKHMRERVLKAKKDTFFERLDLAQQLEAIQKDHHCSQKITALKAKMPLEKARTINWEDLEEEEIERVTTIQACNNPF
jgi:hypothetical protein